MGSLIIRDPMHHVASTEALRVLERTHVQALTCFKVNKIDDDCCGAQIQGETEYTSSIPVYQMLSQIDVLTRSRNHRIDIPFEGPGGLENLRFPTKRGKGDINTSILHSRLASQPERILKETLEA